MASRPDPDRRRSERCHCVAHTILDRHQINPPSRRSYRIPGARRSPGGGLSLFQLFSGLVGFFQTEDTFPAAFDNIAEASNFYPLWPAAICVVLFARWRKIAPVSPLIIALALFLASLSLYCLVPFPRWLL